MFTVTARPSSALSFLAQILQFSSDPSVLRSSLDPPVLQSSSHLSVFIRSSSLHQTFLFSSHPPVFIRPSSLHHILLVFITPSLQSSSVPPSSLQMILQSSSLHQILQSSSPSSGTWYMDSRTARCLFSTPDCTACRRSRSAGDRVLLLWASRERERLRM